MKKKEGGEKKLSFRVKKSTLKKMGKAIKTMISGIKYVHHFLASNPFCLKYSFARSKQMFC